MRKIIHLMLVFFTTSSLIVMAISEEEETTIENYKQEKLAPFFYEITGNNIDSNNPVYLLGTRHDLAFTDYSNEIRNKVENTEILISEYITEFSRVKPMLDLCKFTYSKFIEQDFYWFRDKFIALGFSSEKIEESIKLMQKEKSNLDNPEYFKPFFSQLTEAERELLKTISAEIEMDCFSIHPSFLKLFISLFEGTLREKYSEDSFETYLIKLFKEKNKDIVYLDNPETLSWAVVELAGARLLHQDLSDIKIKQFVCEEKNDWPKFFYYVAVDDNPMEIGSDMLSSSNCARNLSWMKKILKTLSSGKSASIIAGAAHLTGETGLLKLLQSQGYHIKHAFINGETLVSMKKTRYHFSTE